MSSVTSCPACGTSFRVRPEQLSAHHGDVRCGKCDHVFYALDRLLKIEEDQPHESEPKFIVLEEANTYVVEELAAPVSTTDTENTPLEQSVILPAENPGAEIYTPPPHAASRPVLAESRSSEPALQSPTKPRSRVSLWLTIPLLLLLIAAAIAQSAYFLRTQIAVALPQTKPYLVEACMQLSCTVDLPRDIEQLVISDSDMQEDAEHSGVIHLSSTLINHSPHAQAYPLLELSLTDTRDQVVMRRIFKPAEYLPAGTVVANGIAPNDEIHIKLPLTAGETAVAGYRVYVFYS